MPTMLTTIWHFTNPREGKLGLIGPLIATATEVLKEKANLENQETLDTTLLEGHTLVSLRHTSQDTNFITLSGS